MATTPAQYPPFDTEVRPVDVFLRNNPCFLPLHDPPVNVTRETRDYAEVRPPHAPLIPRWPLKLSLASVPVHPHLSTTPSPLHHDHLQVRYAGLEGATATHIQAR